MISLEELYDYCFNEPRIQKLAKSIAHEFHNRDMSVVIDLPQYMKEQFPNKDILNVQSLALLDLVKPKLLQTDIKNLDSIKATNGEIYKWFAMGWFFVNSSDNPYTYKNKTLLAAYLMMPVIKKYYPGIDDYIDASGDQTLMHDLNLDPDRYGLVELSNSMELRKHALIIREKSTMVYPHQFLRRFYKAHFVDMLSILRHCHRNNLKVELRIDPLRRTTPEYYRDVIEMDYWYGKPFREDLLMQKNQRGESEYLTVHRVPENQQEKQDFTYPLRYTIFITDMMAKNNRQFFIAEYVPLAIQDNISRPHGLGGKYIIQKFAHFVFDQNKKQIEHVDGSVRYFLHNDYDEAFRKVAAGRDAGKKIGSSSNRLKLFKVSGGVDLEILKAILYEFFRYNPHISEYFAGEAHQNVY